jgi:hypothetical protein
LALGTILIISIYWVLQLLQQVKKGAALIRHDEAGHFDGFGRDLAFGRADLCD